MQASTQKLSINAVPEVVNFYVGEVLVVNVPKRKFGFDWWAGDYFPDFCNEIILRSIENLLINRVLVCETRTIEESLFKVFKFSEVNDYFQVNITAMTKFGLLEETIVKIVTAKKYVSADTLIALFTYQVLEIPEITNPWRVLLKKILDQNRLSAWAIEARKTWFTDKIEVLFLPTSEKYLYDLRHSIEQQCANERTNNEDFATLSKRLLKLIDKHMENKREKPSGGS